MCNMQINPSDILELVSLRDENKRLKKEIERLERLENMDKEEIDRKLVELQRIFEPSLEEIDNISDILHDPKYLGEYPDNCLAPRCLTEEGRREVEKVRSIAKEEKMKRMRRMMRIIDVENVDKEDK